VVDLNFFAFLLTLLVSFQNVLKHAEICIKLHTECLKSFAARPTGGAYDASPESLSAERGTMGFYNNRPYQNNFLDLPLSAYLNNLILGPVWPIMLTLHKLDFGFSLPFSSEHEFQNFPLAYGTI